MIPKNGCRFSKKIMLSKKLERDDDSKNRHPTPGVSDLLLHRCKDRVGSGM